MSLSPDSLLLLQPFAEGFTRPTFSHMRTLVYGTLLASGRRTVAAALRAMGRGDERHFTTYHRVLNRAVWSPFELSRILLRLLVMVFLSADAPLILLIDGTDVNVAGDDASPTKAASMMPYVRKAGTSQQVKASTGYA